MADMHLEVTTNPSLIAKTTGSNYIDVVSGIARQIEECKLVYH